MSETKRLVSVRKAALVMPVMGQPDKVLVTADSFQVCAPKNKHIRPGDLVLLFRSNTFLPASTPEFVDLEPQTEYAGESGFVIHPCEPLIVNGKVQPGIFNGLVVPVEDFPVVALHIRDNMGSFKDDDALLSALRNTTTFQTYLNVIEYRPGGSSTTSQTTDASSSTSTSHDSLFGMRPFPSTKPFADCRISATQPHQIIGFRPYFCNKLDMINANDIKSLFYSSKVGTKYALTTFMVGSPISIYFVRANSRHIGAVKRAHALPNGGRMGVCSRTLDLQADNARYPHHWAAVRAAGLPAALNALDRSVVVHGVLVGSAIRDNYEGMPATGAGAEIFAYAIVDIDAPNDHTLTVGRMAPTGETTWRLLTERLGLKTVPQHEDGVTLTELARDHAGLGALADGPGWFVEKRAGLVFRNVKTGRGFKVMSRAYVERYGEHSIRNETQRSKWHKLE
ncbi:unnamed protein product [Discula destructiva]